MADENKQADNDEKFNAAFQEMLKRNGLEHPEEHEKKAREYFREHGNLDDFTIVLDKLPRLITLRKAGKIRRKMNRHSWKMNSSSKTPGKNTAKTTICWNLLSKTRR